MAQVTGDPSLDQGNTDATLAQSPGWGGSTPAQEGYVTPPGLPVPTGGGSSSGSGVSSIKPPRNPHWADALYEHYLGKLPTPSEIAWIEHNGLTPESLTQHLRAQPSYVKGLTIGALEDYHTNATPHWDKWLGTKPTDDDIRDLMNRGIKDPQQIEDYLTNRPDVVALHPGAPLKLSDQEFGIKKNQVDSMMLQNVGRTSSNPEALKALQDQSHGPAPRQDFALSSNEKENNQGALTTPNIIAPNARSLA